MEIKELVFKANYFCQYSQQANEIEEWLKYLLNNLPDAQVLLRCFIFPKISTIEDIIYAQTYLNNKLRTGDLWSLALIFQSIRTSTVIHNQTQISPRLQVTVRRKHPLAFCYGKSCLKKGLKHKLDSIFSLKSCQFHRFCKDCLKAHVSNKFQKNSSGLIFCEGCENTGKTQNNLFITDEEICYVLGVRSKEVLNLAQYQANLKTCQSNDLRCANPGVFLDPEDFVAFPCEDIVCKDCFVRHVSEYVLKIHDFFMNDPKQLKSFPVIGILCMNQHLNSLRQYDLLEMNQILSLSCFAQVIINELQQFYQNFKPIFDGKPFNICSNCSTFSFLTVNSKQFCSNCTFCLLCNETNHQGISCNELKKMKSSDVYIERFPEVACDPKDPLFLKFSKILNNSLRSKTHKMIRYGMIHPSGLIQFACDQFQKTSVDVKHSYVVSKSFPDFESVERIALDEVQPDSDGFFKFNKNLEITTGEAFIIVYKVFYSGTIVARHPRADDRLKDQYIFSSIDQIILLKKESILPYAVLHLQSTGKFN